jgi:methyl-accepting chemotaxis protein
MNFRLKNLSFGTRLLGIVLIPLIAFIASTGFLFYSSIHDKQHLDQLKMLPEFSISASALVHNLQIERGLSAGYIGSKGNSFGTQLTSHTRETDRALQTLKESISKNDLNVLYPGADAAIEDIFSRLDKLPQVRSDVRSLSWDLKTAVGYYTDINSNILALIETLSALSSNNEIAKLGLASVNFMNIKERSGIIRAVLASAFAANKFSPGMRDKFITLLAEQKIFRDKFLHFSTPETRHAYNSLIAQPVFQETAQLVTTALENRGGDFGIDANHWFRKQTEKINQLKKFEDELTKKARERTELLSLAAARAIWMEFAIGGVVLLFTLIFSHTLIRRLSNESRLMSESLVRISHGELSGESYPYNTPEFSALSCMQRKLIEVNTAIENVTHTVRNSAMEISQSNNSLAQRAEEQASNLERTAASMEQITATVRLTAENLQQGNQLSVEANKYANDGQVIVSKAVIAMNEINDDSKKIADIINVIDEIAFQTNLLALNAAVEAARAGEQGRGFAVVASEVRNLAQRSASAAQDIKTLIEASVKKINSGSELVNASGQSLTNIVDAVTKVSEIISEITTAGEEQALGVEQINDSLMKLDDVNHQNTSMVEEVAVSSRILEEQSTELEHLISFYHISEKAHKSSPATQTDPIAPPTPAHEARRAGNRPWSEDTSGRKQEKETPLSTPKDDQSAWEAF